MARPLVRIMRQHQQVPFVAGGLRYDVYSSALKNEETPSCKNIVMGESIIEKRKGVSAFAGTGAAALTGIVMKLNYTASELICHTTDKVYAYNSGTGLFVDITEAATTYNGTQDDPISDVYFDAPATPLYIWTNGVESPKKWDLAGANVSALDNATNYITKWLLYFGSRLCLYNLVDTGTSKPLRVRWSIVGNPEDFSGTGSSFADITAVLGDDLIMRAEKLGTYAVIYGQKGLCLQDYRAYVNNPFGFSTRVPSIGLAASRALINLFGREHIFLGYDDIYSYKGGREVQRLGRPIRRELFSIIDNDSIDRCFMIHMMDKNKVRLYIPTKGHTTTQMDVYFELNLEEGTWSRGTGAYTGFGEYGTSGITVDELAGSVDEQAWVIDSLGIHSGDTIDMFGDINGVVYKADNTTHDDAGVAVAATFDTKDFVEEYRYRGEVTHWMELSFEAKGTSVDVYYSDDFGKNYTFLETVALTGDWERYEVAFEVNSPGIRFSFQNNDSASTFQIRWYEIGYIKAGKVLAGED